MNMRIKGFIVGSTPKDIIIDVFDEGKDLYLIVMSHTQANNLACTISNAIR